MPTIRELAQALGVSPTTVSRVMNGRGRISAATRESVLQHIRDANYTPNVNAQRLKAGRTNMVALNFDDWSDALADMYLAELTHGVQDALESHDYGLLLTGTYNRLQQWANSRAIDGIILASGNLRDEAVLRAITATGTPCVLIGHYAMSGIPNVGSVVVELAHGARQVARLLVDYGHRRIGFLRNPDPEDLVLDAFQDEMERLGQPLDAELVVPAGRTPEDGVRATHELLARSEPPTALFARTDSLAAGALRAARQRSLQVPNDLSVVGHDDVPFAGLAEPPLTTVRVNCLALGNLATMQLLALLNRPDESPEVQCVQTELVLRQSVAKMLPT